MDKEFEEALAIDPLVNVRRGITVDNTPQPTASLEETAIAVQMRRELSQINRLLSGDETGCIDWDAIEALVRAITIMGEEASKRSWIE